MSVLHRIILVLAFLLAPASARACINDRDTHRKEREFGQLRIHGRDRSAR